MCSHEAPHSISSSKLGQEMWLSLHSSLLGDMGLHSPLKSSVWRKGEGLGIQYVRNCRRTQVKGQ